MSYQYTYFLLLRLTIRVVCNKVLTL